jgi:hypothetical protein
MKKTLQSDSSLCELDDLKWDTVSNYNDLNAHVNIMWIGQYLKVPF